MGPQPSRFRDVLARIKANSDSGFIAEDSEYGSLSGVYEGGDCDSMSSWKLL
jgi:hypothetical protein